MMLKNSVLSNPASVLAVLGLAATARAHVAAWHEAMWCLNGNTGAQDLNSYDIVSPLYQLPFSQWWFHAVNNCDKFPPAPGKFIDLPAGGNFRIEIASNRAKTSLSYGGRDTSEWPDGEIYPQDYHDDGCIISPNLHTQNEAKAAGTAFAISYHSDIKQVTPQNLVVFSVRYHTPFRRVVYYDVPAAMPPCPPEGCICAWGWVPNGCGQPNMYHQAFRCRVTNSRSNTPLAAPKPPVWCEGDESKCVKGAKQMVYWNQLEGNNVFVDGRNRAGEFKSPGYNMVMGFRDGAQNDIFAGPASSSAPPPSSNNKPPPSSSSPAASSPSSTTYSIPNSNDPPTTPAADGTSPAPTTGVLGGLTRIDDLNTTQNTVKPPVSEEAKRPGRCDASRKRRRALRAEMKRREEVKREEVKREEVRREEVKREPEEVKREEVKKRGVAAHHHARRTATF